MPDSACCPPARFPCQQTVPVVEQVQLARDTYRLRLAAPELAEAVVPGQFFMVRAPGLTDPLLGRPFALYDTWLDDAGRPIPAHHPFTMPNVDDVDRADAPTKSAALSPASPTIPFRIRLKSPLSQLLPAMQRSKASKNRSKIGRAHV